LFDEGKWFASNEDASNISGFSGVPGGFKSPVTGYDYFTGNSMFWSTFEKSLFSAPNYYLSYIAGGFYVESYNKHYGLAVRCLRD
jgi:uncharacterized protein (TIGR02145 family)